VTRHQLDVVEDRSVVHADHGSVTDGVVVGCDSRMALGVVADVEEDLRSVRRDRETLEHRARAAALLVHDDATFSGSVGVADRIGSTFRDRGQQRLGRARPIDVAARVEAKAGDTAHSLLIVDRETGVSG
jgi:hypothetical protein